MLRRDSEAGVVLINVLVILALAASVVFAMVSLSDLAIQRSQRYSSAGQALALIAAGEASAIVALRRDMAEGLQTDNVTEAWAQTGQQTVEIEGGSFALQIEDAQSRFNLNSLPQSGALGLQILQRIVKSLDLQDLIVEAGLTASEVTQLAELATVLPGRTDINLNTAPVALLGVLADNPVQANRLEGLRKRKSFLTSDDLATANVILPLGAGFVSRYFLVSVDVTLGDSAQHMQTLLQRRNGPGGVGEVVAVFRQNPVTSPAPPS
jgi:general secretion pathway protein K